MAAWRMRRAAKSAAFLVSMLMTAVPAGATDALQRQGLVQDHLYDGTLAAGAAQPVPEPERPGAADRRFASGLVKFARAIEHLGQSLYRYGLRPPIESVPILRMPVPQNPRPERLTYEGFRAVLQAFVDDLAAADAALVGVGGEPVRLPVDLGRIRLDITGDGGKRDDERLWVIVNGVAPSTRERRDAALDVVLDAGDVAWLRGYAHLLAGFCEWMLAHDFRQMFDASFGLFFPRAGLEETYVGEEDRLRTDLTGVGHGDVRIADAIALIHLVHWPVIEPERMRAARAHLLQVVAASRASWRAILARHDDEVHWIPGPGGKSIVTLPVTRERIGAWLELLDDAEAILQGRKLVPHWRFRRGVDVARVFENPRTFDLVLWLTGPGAQPFLADGPMVSDQTWRQIGNAFGGNFLNYAFWFN